MTAIARHFSKGAFSCKLNFSLPTASSTGTILKVCRSHASSFSSLPNRSPPKRPGISRENAAAESSSKPTGRGLTWALVSSGVAVAVGIAAYEKRRRIKTGEKTVGIALPSFCLWPDSVFALEDSSKTPPGTLKPDLPTYTMAEVSKHVSKDTGIWVTYKNGVYDITEYAKVHPGGKIILLSAGKAMEPFWEKHRMHYNDVVYEQLEHFRIGNIKEVAAEKPQSPNSDVKPWMMPERKCLEMAVGRRQSILLENLKKDFPKKIIVTAVKCSSSKTEKKEMKWVGVGLSDLLRAQGVDLDKVEHKFLVFESLQKRPDNSPHASLYPMETVRSLKEDIIIAYEVNDEPIPPLQGHPFRVIVKGLGGGKQVKWLHRIRFSTEEEDAAC